MNNVFAQSNWPNLEKGRAVDSLWQHEWDKHGTCSSQSKKLIGEMSYFSSTLNIYDSFPFDQWFAEAGITPSDSTKWTESKAEEAIKKYLSQKVIIHCQKAHGDNVIDSISVCMDKNSLSPIDCPAAQAKSTCAAGFIYPTKDSAPKRA